MKNQGFTLIELLLYSAIVDRIKRKFLKPDRNKGQSLVELIIAVGVFSIATTLVAVFIIDGYLSNLQANQSSLAVSLAEEGMEAARSIRDSNWDDLVVGNHGLAISGNRWVFQGIEEDLSGKLNQGKRIIAVEDIGENRRQVRAKVLWEMVKGRPEEIELVSYLSNWHKLAGGIEVRKPTTYTDSAGRTTSPANAYDYPDGTTWASTLYNITRNPSIRFYNWQASTQIYISLVLKYRYHADLGTNDTYAVAYSITGCTGTFIDLVPPTSSAAPDTTVSANLSPSLDLANLCVKIYTQKVGSADDKSLYTRDIWTEGSY